MENKEIILNLGWSFFHSKIRIIEIFICRGTLNELVLLTRDGNPRLYAKLLFVRSIVRAHPL